MAQVEDQNNTSTSPMIATLHPDIINSHILTLLDGPTLASTASSSSELRRLCTPNHLWHNISTSIWPSLNDPLAAALISTFPAGHRSIFSDSYPSPSIHHHRPISPSPPPPELISAVDIYYKDKPLFSKVHLTKTHKGWFHCSPLWVDLLETDENVPTPLKLLPNDDVEWLRDLQENLRLSWIMIDPTRKRAANLSSRRAVSARWHWLTGEVEVVYAVAMEEEVQCIVKVTCCGKVGGNMHVREVSMTMEDMDGRHVIGRESMVILQNAMEGVKRKRVDGDEAKESYEKFCCMKMERRERLMRKAKALDMLTMLVTFTIFILLLWFFKLSFTET